MYFSILDLFLHSFYKNTHRRNDIALILIDGQFVFSLKVHPICLPAEDTDYDTGKDCRVSGFGRTASENRGELFFYSSILRVFA